VVPPAYAPGQKETHDDYDCHEPVYTYAPVSFTVGGVQWDPALPGSLTNSFTSTAYVNVTSSDPDLCASPGRVDIGSCTWCVSTKTTNCSASGYFTLTNATVSPTNACIGTTFSASATSIASNATVIITTHCPCSTNADVYTTNHPAPTIVSNWWTASVGSFSTNGQGLSASFTPTNCGNGTVTFNLTYVNNTPCDTNRHTVSISKNFVVHQTTITFDDSPSDGATPWSVSFKLEAVCVSGTNNVATNYSQTYTSLASITWGIDVAANGVVTLNKAGDDNTGDINKIVVTQFTDTSAGGTHSAHIAAYFIGCCDSGQMNWVQTITKDTDPLPGKTIPYFDCFTGPPTQTPYYFGWPGSGAGWDLISTHTTICP